MLFTPHRADVDALQSTATKLGGVQGDFETVADEVLTRATTAAGTVQGDLVTPVSTVTAPVRRSALDLGDAATVVQGCLTRWASAVRIHNTTVGRLNFRWSMASATGFGVDEPTPDPDATAQERQQAAQTHTTQVDAAREQLRRELTTEHDRSLDDLDDVATEVVGYLRKGPTEQVLHDLMVAGALPATVLADHPGITLTDAEVAALQAELERTGQLDDFLAPPPLGTPSADLAVTLALARRMDVEATEYAELLQQMYVSRAAESAGIDLTTWDVDQGAAHVTDQYEASYEYYAQLYLQNPEFRWAGMAAMIGPSFAAGFEDLEMFQTVAQDIDGALIDVPAPLRGALPPPLDSMSQLDALAGLGDEELAFYQETFLQMQKDIFYDASMMHEAYLDGGTEAIDELAAAGLLDGGDVDATVQAWNDIDTGYATGDDELLNAGNEYLLYREQADTIDEGYQQMKDHLPTGPLMTYLMGAIGQPSIPGTQTLGEVDGIDVDVDTSTILPGVQGGSINTNLPEGNIADFDTRWGLIQDDTLPVFQDLVENDPELVEELLTTDVRDRIDQQRLAETYPELIGMLTDLDWDWSLY